MEDTKKYHLTAVEMNLSTAEATAVVRKETSWSIHDALNFVRSVSDGKLTELSEYELRVVELFADVNYKNLDPGHFDYAAYYAERDREYAEAKAWFETLSEPEKKHVQALQRAMVPTAG